MVSIFDEERDTTGSRQARLDLLKEGVRVFVGPPRPRSRPRAIHQLTTRRAARGHGTSRTTPTLQVAAELGIVGLVPFLYLIVRAAVLAARAAPGAHRAARRPCGIVAGGSGASGSVGSGS